MLVTFSTQAVGIQFARSVFAERLPDSELKALTQYPNWVAGSCDTNASAAEAVGTVDVSAIVKKYKLQSAVIQKVGGKVIGQENADKPPVSPASTMKLVIADTVLQEKEPLSKRLSVTSDVYYDGSNENLSATITVEDAIKKMLGESNNVAANVLMKSLGGVSDFTSKANKNGYKNTNVKAYYSSGAMGLNKSSIGDQANAMDHIFTTDGAGYSVAKSALQGATDHYGVGGKARKWAGNSMVAGSVAMFSVGGSDYIVGLYYEGNYDSQKAKDAVKDGTKDLVAAITSGSSAGVSGKAVGDLPAGGKDVGASWYDGPGTQGSVGVDLAGTFSYAELGSGGSIGDAMGKLKDKQKLAISYKGKTVIAEKLDVGSGGGDVKGKPREIDLWKTTSDYLGLTSAGVDVVNVQGVADDTPVGPLDGSVASGEEASAQQCCASGGAVGGATGSATGNAAATSGSWKSGLQPPYILEQWAIETLKDVAAKMDVDEKNTVTPEHVTALVAFAIGEGGDIMNSDLYNPLNTGLNAPELLASANNASGLQSFKSFDAGVEAAARTIVGSNQDRLAEVLIKPGSTAKDFMYALTYFNKYPGNQLWAEASSTDPNGYYKERLALIKQVNSNYKGTAGIVIGTAAYEQSENTTKPNLLQFSGTGGGADGALGGGECSSSTGDASAIVEKALEFSWPDSSHGTTPKPEYAKAISKYNSGANAADCGVFVATAVIASGADPDFPKAGTFVQEPYVRSHPEKYDVVDKVSSVSDLEPGDILIVNQGDGSGGNGHIWIYVGKQPPNNFDNASASLNSRAANLGPSILSDSRGDYMRARLK